jgi:glyoxylase-like metal-dependent hydrolase (beta-lactamase superfamily II)
MMLFDPCRETDFYLEFAKRHKARIIATFETHLQADYISGSPRIAALTGASFNACHRDFGGAAFAYTPLADGQVFTVEGAGPVVRALCTPGHTPGSTSYMVDGRFLISGDTLFIVSVGRPDLGGKVDEWAEMLFHTLTQRIAPLDGSVQVLPAHFMAWSEAGRDLIFMDSLGSVLQKNQEIFGMTDPGRFLDFIRRNMRPQPEVYAKIRQVNAGLLAVEPDEENVMDLGKNECAASQGK